MALKKCRECSKQVSTKADKCPNCGVKNPTNNPALNVLLGAGLVIIILIWLFSGSEGEATKMPNLNESSENTRFSSTSLNVRSGPSTDHEAIGVLSPGELISVVADSQGWLHIESVNNDTEGWVSASYTLDITQYSEWEDDNKNEPPKKTPPKPVWNPKVDKIMAHVMLEGFVEDRLKSPSTAEFPSAWSYDYDTNIDYMGSQTYKIRSWVDSQNGFGAMVRTHFTGTIKQTNEDTWRLIDLEVHE